MKSRVKKKQGTQGDEYHLLWQMRRSIRSLFFGRRGWNRNDRCFFKRSLGSPVIMGRVIGVGYCETSAYWRRAFESALNKNRLEFQVIFCVLFLFQLFLCTKCYVSLMEEGTSFLCECRDLANISP